MTTEISNRDYVNSLARGLEVIRAFTRAQPRMTLSEIARMTGMTRATVRRFLLTLVKEGYAETDGKYFSLRPKVLELGFAALSSMTMLDVMIAVGGVTDFADANNATVVRVEEGEQKEYRARIDDLIKDGDISANVAILPGDVIIIPESVF